VQALQSLTKVFAARAEEKKMPAFSLVEDEKGALIVKMESDPLSDLKLLRGMFKRDTPFTTYLSLMGTLATNASGVTNFQVQTTSVSSTSEWTVVNGLFDEFFLHAMEVIYSPINKNATAGTSATMPATSVSLTTAGQTYAGMAGAILVSLFGPPAYYSAAAGMSNNPNAKFVNLATDWRYSWKNNVRFDPHGMTFSSTTSTNGWQGWSYISDAAQYGGAIQMRTINDQVIGDATHVINLGNYTQRYLVSFRSRA